ncbi:MAG: nreC [Myxococcales bacterium]|nr:nreC [Myxococcales bacterium]
MDASLEGPELNLVLVDDHAVFRQALRALFSLEAPDLHVLGEVATARQAMALVPTLEPDLVIMDILLPGASGVAAVRDLRRGDVACPILVLTALSDAAFVVDAFSAGAQGYALKEQPFDELMPAIRRVAEGHRYLAPGLEVETAAAHGNGSGGLIEDLSVREREIFNLVVAGHTNQQMAAELYVSIKTIETHRSRINRKLRVHSTAELMRFAALRGLVTP